jgi:hypothetical protein
LVLIKDRSEYRESFSYWASIEPTTFDEGVMSTIGVVTVSVVGTLLAVCVAAVHSKKLRITIDFDVDGGFPDDRIGLVNEVEGSKAMAYAAIAKQDAEAKDVEEHDGGGVVVAASKEGVSAEEDLTQDDCGLVYAADVKIKWFPLTSPIAMVNQSYSVAYELAKLQVEFDIEPWYITWRVGLPNEAEFGAVMVGPLTGRVYPSGKYTSRFKGAVSPNEPNLNEDGSPRVIFFLKKRLAVQAAVACFIAGEGGTSGFLEHGDWLEGISDDMPNWVVRAVARRVTLVKENLAMDVLSADVGKIMDVLDNEDDEDDEDDVSY